MASFSKHDSFDWLGIQRLNLFIAIGNFLLLLATAPGPLDSAEVWRTLIASFIYTLCIGTLSFYAITQLIEPMPYRSEMVAWSLVVVCCLGMAVVGSALAEGVLSVLQVFPCQPFSGRFYGGLKIALVVSTVAGIGKYAYDRMRVRLERQNIELQKVIETGSARARLQEEDVQKAREIQEGLLPKQIAQIRGYQVSGVWQPALTVGGDYYDVLSFGESMLGIAIADVVGKGVSAALLMANLQAAVRAFAADARHPSEVCEKINAVMCSNIAIGKFITFFYGLLDAARRKLTYCNAGHNPPILVRGEDVARLEEGGALLGIFPDWKFEQRSIELLGGDRILLFTDGITEAENRSYSPCRRRPTQG
jgi:sigma-B regulation protein RsbU (phosphoserine phosphatase)